MTSIKHHPNWSKFVEATMMLTGYYEDNDNVYIAEEAHRNNGYILKARKSKVWEILDKYEGDDFDDLMEIFYHLDRI